MSGPNEGFDNFACCAHAASDAKTKYYHNIYIFRKIKAILTNEEGKGSLKRNQSHCGTGEDVLKDNVVEEERLPYSNESKLP